jgi:hypothetical protein
VLFVDVTKAFPTVWLDGLWKKLWDAGVTGKCFRVLNGLYQGAKRVVSHDNVVSDEFACDLGLHEGDPISPTLYLFFINDMLKEIWDKHPGVQIVDCSTGAISDVVAAMQADDLVVICESLAETQAVAQTIFAYSEKWRFKLNSIKSAVMHVPTQGCRSTVHQSGIVWGGVPVPVVQKYCYLGLWFQSDLSREVHFQHVLHKMQNVTRCYMPLWKSRHVSVEVKRIVLLSCVRPIIEYASEVWVPNANQRQKLNVCQLEIIKTSMRLLSYKPCNEALLAEWGLKPMHMWLHERVMMFYAKLRLMPAERLPKKVFDACWTHQGRSVCLPWQRYVNGLLCKYGVTLGANVSDYDACMSVIKSRVKSLWHEDVTLITPLEKTTLTL